MSNYRIVERYSKSLVDLAQERNELDEIIGDVRIVLEALEVREFYLLVKSPIINPGHKKDILSSIFQGKINPLTLDFMHVLIKKGREKLLPEILNGTVKRFQRVRGITPVRMITAVEMDAGILEKVKTAVESIDGIDKVEMTTDLDQDIIGGLILDFGDRLIDSSVKHELKLLQKTFATASLREA